MFRRRNIILNSLLVVALGVIGFFGWRTLYPAAAVATERTATVSLQNVSTSVSATGAVQTSEDIGLNFQNTGIVRSVNVKVGDNVRKGQLLGTVDDRAARLALLQAQVSQKSAEVSLTNAKLGVTSAEVSLKNTQVSVANAQQAVANAQIAVQQGQQNAEQTQVTDEQAIVNAQVALAKLMAGPTAATLAVQAQQITSQQLSIDSAAAAYANAQTTQKQLEATIALNLIGYNTSVNNAQYDYDLKCSLAPGNDCTTLASTRPYFLTLQSAMAARTAGVLKDSQSDTNAIASVDSAHRSLLTAQAAMDSLKVQQVQSNQPATQLDIDSANANIAAAQRAKDNAAIAATEQAALAAGTVVTAQGSLDSIRASIVNSKGSVTSAEGSVTNAQGTLQMAKANVGNAWTNEANTRMYAPVSATVAAIASEVGVNAGITTAGSSGASGYIVLTNLSGLQVKASFAEADVVSLKAGQAATFTFDAIANATAQGTVLAIAPLSNASSGSVTTYTVTFSLDNAPAEVKPGMTAQATVVTADAQGVLAVTSSALTDRGGSYFVTMKPTKVGVAGVRRAVTIGLKGDSATEITSGLKEGDQVVLRTTTSSSSAANNGFPGAGVPGGGIAGAARGNG